MAVMKPLEVHVTGLPQMKAALEQLTAQRDRARSLAQALEGELETALRDLDAARAEVAHRDATMRGGG